jgi:hypothetical protein
LSEHSVGVKHKNTLTDSDLNLNHE